uniref:Protein PRRC1 n=1 Tax=Aceria tosichella TaxID=561515 RepID=A0A6G1S725_9ACAR
MDQQVVISETGEQQTMAQNNQQQQTVVASHSSQQDALQSQQQLSQTIPSMQSQMQLNETSSVHDVETIQSVTSQPLDNTTTPQQNVTVQIPIQQPSPQQPQVQSYPPPIKPLLEGEPNTGLPAFNNGQNQSAQQDVVTLSPQKSAITKVTLSDELNIFYWTKTKEIINQIAEEAKSSVVSVITTLDPGMKEYLYSGGNVNIIVISETECLVSPIRDSFQSAFGRATVNPASYDPPNRIIDYPVRLACGFQGAITVAQEKIKKLRQDTSSVPQNQVIVVVQPTLVPLSNTTEISETDDNSNDLTSSWFSTYCILIEDPVLNVMMKCFSQFIPVDLDVVKSAREVKFPDNFLDTRLGFAASLDELMSYKMNIDPMGGFGDENGCFWIRKWAGISESQIIQQLSLTLANSYRRKCDDSVRIDTIS